MFGLKDKNTGFVGKRIYSIEKYLEIEARLPEVYEFWNEHVIKLNKPDFFKESIFNLEKVLSEKLSKTNNKLFSNFFSKKKKIWIESENCLFYPDLFVVRDEIEYYPNCEDIVVNPVMIIEVSTQYSMGSMDGVRGDQSYLTNRTTKFWNYQKLSSIEEYVLINDVGLTVIETYNRIDETAWKYQLFSQDKNIIANFESIDIQIPVRNIYL